MKKLMIIAGIVGASITTQAIAEEPVTTRHDYCSVIGQVAEQVMAARQVGVDIEALLNNEHAKEVPFWETVVIDAYKHSRYSTQQYRESAAQEFRNSYFIKCMEDRL